MRPPYPSPLERKFVNAAPTPRAARLAVLTLFFVNGTVLSSWVPHIPLVKERLGLSDGVLGLALLGVAVGAITAMPLAGMFIARRGSQRVMRVATVAFCLSLPLPVLAPSLPLLVLALVMFGAGNGAMDVAMNAQAVGVEKAHGGAIMSSFHAFFSVGGLAGSSLGGLLLWAGVSPAVHVLLVTSVFGLVGLMALRWLWVDRAEDAEAGGPAFVRPTGPLLALGVLAFFVLVGEGSVADWSAVYLRDTLGTGAGVAALGYAAFSLMMALGRFTGDRMVARFGPVPLMRSSAALAAAGLGAGLIIGHPVAAVVGFGCVGLGMSNLIPILFSAAGRTPGVNAGTAIAAVSSAGYFGFLAGPPLIGLLAEATSLPLALGLVVLFTALVAVFAHAADRATEARAPDAVQEPLV